MFHIVDTMMAPLIGLKSCITLKLIKINYLNTLKSEEKSLDEILINYSDVFKGIGKIKMKHKIRLRSDAIPKIHPPRKVPIGLHEQLKEKLDELEAQGMIAKVTEPTAWVNSLVIVRKNNGDLRLCLDPSDLNKYIEREHYYILSLDEITYKLTGAKVFSILDCTQGFWQIVLDDESTSLVTFNTPFNRYKLLRLPYGLNSSLEVFQRVMTEMFSSMNGVAVYFDDILVWGWIK